MSKPAPIVVRPATTADAPAIIDFNCQLAWETEHKLLDRDVVSLGVAAALSDPHKARYFVACDGPRPIGQLMHTREWSDWRNGDLWWLQSVYVASDYRGRGVFRLLFDHLRGLAEADPGVVGLRLYVERDNIAAREVYTKLGLSSPHYEVLELMFS